MKTHTSNLKTNIKTLGRVLNDRITYTLYEQEVVLTGAQINSITPHFESEILKSAMKVLEIDSNVYIPPETILTYDLGVRVENNFEYLNYGNYVVESAEKKEDTKSWEIICYDKMLYSMKDYVALDITYPITINNYIKEICDYLGLTFANYNEEFPNYNKEIDHELYISTTGNKIEYTFRDVLNQLAEVTASTICINNDDELELRYINETNDTIDEEFLKDVNVNFGKKFGPINSIVLSRAGESDNVYLRDDESIQQNGLCEVKIVENQIMNFNNRADFLPDILDQLNGLEYYINDYSSTGICYYEMCDKYNVSIDNNIYPCIMFNDEIDRTQGLEEFVHTDMPETSETDYKKADKTDQKIDKAYLIVDKQNQTISGVVERQSQITSDLENNYYTKTATDELIVDTVKGFTNKYTVGGGNNLLRNTGLYFETSTDNYSSGFEFWNGSVKRITNMNSKSKTSMYLQNDILNQRQEIPNDIYTISFQYNQLNPLATATVTINDVEYELGESGIFEKTIEIQTSDIRIQFECDVDDGYEIYELMCNFGETALIYSQNANETKTDTVEISEGIKITSDTTDSIFKANADGIRVENSYGNTTTEFLDTGTKTTNLEADKATIAKLLIQEVDGQVWIVGI